MNDLEYLNQISAGVNQPAKTGFFDKKMKIIFGVLGGVILLFIILLVATSGSKSNPEATATSELGRLYTRAGELTKTITTYNSQVRSSSLRSTGTSFSTLLAEMSSTTSNYLTGTFGADVSTLVIPSEDTLNISELNSTLETARLNGILDRKYASEMYYQIRLLLALEDSIASKTTNSSLITYLSSSKESLTLLEARFENFSESE